MLFEDWWEDDSGWGGYMMAEGNLAKDAWDRSRGCVAEDIVKQITPIMEELFDLGFDEEGSVGQKLNTVRQELILIIAMSDES